MEGYTLRQQPLAALRGTSRLLRLASDERLIQLTRSGQQAAFEALVGRYNARLLAFCRHMLHSREDAEDVLQEVFAAAFNAIMADSREINVRPWLYRIARNRSLNHLRRNTAIGVDSMDTHFADAGQSTSERAHKREEFRLLLDDIAHLPETQRSALVLREMDALSYEQIAEAMDTTVPAVKSLLVRARIGLAEAAEARKLTCDEVRLELGAAAEGISSLSAPFRRHVKDCDRCRAFRSHLRTNNRALAAIFPLGPLLLFKKAFLLKLGLAKFAGGSAGTAGASAGTAGASVGGGAAIGSVAATGGGLGSIAAGAVVVKAVAVAATVAIVAVGASKALAPHTTPLPRATTTQVDSLAQTAHLVRPAQADAALAPPPDLPVIRHRALRLGRHQVPVLPPVLYPAAALVGASTTPVTTTPVVSTPATTPAAGTPAAVTAPAPTPTPTPTTQEISTTTVFPASTGSTGPATTTPTTQEISTTTAFPGTTGSTGTSTTTVVAGSGPGATGAGHPAPARPARRAAPAQGRARPDRPGRPGRRAPRAQPSAASRPGPAGRPAPRARTSRITRRHGVRRQRVDRRLGRELAEAQPLERLEEDADARDAVRGDRGRGLLEQRGVGEHRDQQPVAVAREVGGQEVVAPPVGAPVDPPLEGEGVAGDEVDAGSSLAPEHEGRIGRLQAADLLRGDHGQQAADLAAVGRQRQRPDLEGGGEADARVLAERHQHSGRFGLEGHRA